MIPNRIIRGFILWSIFACIHMPFACALASASEDDAPDSNRILLFADYALEQGDYDTAIIEFKRFIFFYPLDGRVAQATFKTGMAYYNTGRYGMAGQYFDRVIRDHGDSDHGIDAAFMAARSDARLNDHNAALYRLRVLSNSEVYGTDVRDKAMYHMGWVYLERRDHAASARAFAAVSDANRHRYRIDDLLQRLEDLKTLPSKSPLAAGIFSIIPGGGYLYNRRYQDAFISFVFVGAGAGAAYDCFDNDLNVLGSIAALTALGFYSGSIYGSIGAAHKYNARAYDDFVFRLNRDFQGAGTSGLSFFIQPDKDGAALGLNYSF